MKKSTQDVLAHLIPGAIAIIVFVSVVLGIPYLMAKTGFATWLIGTSSAHPVVVGAVLVVTGIPLFYFAGRIFGEK